MSFFKRLLGQDKPSADTSESSAQETPLPPSFDASQLQDPEAAHANAVERRLRKRQNAQRGLIALIIDDSPTIVAAMSKTLRSVGYFTHEAGTAEEGLDMIASVRPHLIFLDIILPGMNGFSALRQLRRDSAAQHIPVIMISGNEHATEQFYANRIGADDFMKKPFSRFEVFSRIEGLLDDDLIPRRKGSQVAPAATQAAPIAVEAIAAVPDAALIVPVTPTAATPTPVTPEVPAPTLEAAVAAITSSIESEEQVSAMPAQSQHVALAEAIPAGMSAMEARKELNAMGLQYFDQEQYAAALRRGDTLAVALFVRGGGVVANPETASPSVLALAQFRGQAALAAIRKKSE